MYADVTVLGASKLFYDDNVEGALSLSWICVLPSAIILYDLHLFGLYAVCARWRR